MRYHVFVHSLAQRVLSHIRRQELLHAGERVGLAVSGGIDSVSLLRLMLELRGKLGIVLSVVHFNHKLRGAESDADAAFVADLARGHGLQFYCDSDDVAGHAAAERISLEAAARELRYGFFRHLIREGELQGLNPSRENPPQRGPEGPLFHGDSERSSTKHAVSKLDKILTGHTLDDQAETVLMRLIRGAGLRGLGGIHPQIAVEGDDGEICGEIIRPLLEIRRRDLEQYLNDIGQAWREDSTNADDHFTRNRVRQLVVPLLEREFNPSVAENLAELAEIARGEEDYWDNEVAGWMGTAVHWAEPEWVRALSKGAGLVQIAVGEQGSEPDARLMRSQKARTPRAARPDPGTGKERPFQDDNPLVDLAARIQNAPWLVMTASVDRMWFLSEPAAVQRRLVKAIGDEAGISFEFKHVEEILRFAAEDGRQGKELSLPLGWKLTRNAAELLFLTPDLREPTPQQDYEYELAVPGEVAVNEIQARFEVRKIEATKVSAGMDTAYNSDQLLNADSLPRSLWVRNWRPGDRFWPNHTKSPRKIKELLHERHIPQPDRKLWPVIVIGGGSGTKSEIVWVRGFPSPAKFIAKPGREAVVILESTLGRRQTT